MSTAAASTAPDPAERKEAEWKECRSTIGRLDAIIADFWKYGFTFVTTLITASALLTQQAADKSSQSAPNGPFGSGSEPSAAASAVIVLGILTTAVFALERYFVVIRNGALKRALELESGKELRMKVTAEITAMAKRSGVTFVEPVLFLSLLYALSVLGPKISPPVNQTSVFLTSVIYGCGAFVAGYWLYTELQAPRGSYVLPLCFFLAYVYAGYRVAPAAGLRTSTVLFALAATAYWVGHWIAAVLFLSKGRSVADEAAGLLVLAALLAFGLSASGVPSWTKPLWVLCVLVWIAAVIPGARGRIRRMLLRALVALIPADVRTHVHRHFVEIGLLAVEIDHFA